MVKNVVFYLLICIPSALFGQQYSFDVIETTHEGNVFSPAFYDEKLVICSDQDDRSTRRVLDNHGNFMADLYLLDPWDSIKVKRFDKVFRTDFHDGPISFSGDGTRCIISRNLATTILKKGSVKNKNFLGLFESRFNGTEWSEPVPLSFNQASYSCTHPTLSEDGNTLIFASNMGGGLGGFDLWKSTRTRDTWSTPVHLGKEINSMNDELFPIINNGELFFSSNRSEFGGLDIYKACSYENICGPESLPKPFNSDQDDFGLISRDFMESGFLTSNRGGEFDQIWKFSFVYPEFNDCDTLVEDNFCYSLYEENAYELGGVESLIYRWDINGVKRYGYEIEYCFPEIGEYEVTVDIIDTIIDKVYAEQDYFLLNIDYEHQPYISAPDTVKPGEKFTVNSDRTYLPGVTIEDYYWFFSDNRNFKASSIEHSFSEVGDYMIKLGVTGLDEYGEAFSDCTIKPIVCTTAEFERNKPKKASIVDLSENVEIVEESQADRPIEDSVMVTHSIDVIESKEEVPLDDPKLQELTNEFDVKVKYIEEEDQYVYYIGEWKEIEDAHMMWKDLVERGHDDATVISFAQDSIGGIPINSVFTLDNIQFDVNKWDVRPEAAKNIEELLDILKKYENLNLSISAHTDDVGTHGANQILSQKRAESIADYLNQRGIAFGRMEKKGFGETKPIDTNETPEGRQNNRRVEFELNSK